jgi:hypothetical protein
MAGIKDNVQFQQLRENLESRNLYTPNNPYEINNPKVIQAINSISKIINPTKSFDLTNTVLGRLVGPNTPIAQIGIQQLGKQFAQRVTQNALTAGLPSLNFNNLFDGNPNTKLFTKRVDYRITRDETNTTVQNIVDRISGTQRITIPYSLTPPVPTNLYSEGSLNNITDNNTLIRNTGKGVLHFVYDSINRNTYKPSNSSFIGTTNDQGYSIIPAGPEWYNRLFFPTIYTPEFPDSDLANRDILGNLTALKIKDLKSIEGQDNLAYGAKIDSFGKSLKESNASAQNLPNENKALDFEFVNDAYGFGNSNPENQIIWGRDGLSSMASKFGTRTGMLAYTRALLTARGSNSSIDQTKTKWYDKNGQPIYNGSPLTRDNDGVVRTERQHSILDPYNNYKKAIRFKGNYQYDAPSESVISRYVIPRMHPLLNKNTNSINNKNMMFSIENLAYALNSSGHLGDISGTKVPKSEVGANLGRVMWFPPYGIQFSESSLAKYDSTVIIGRGEPIYTYSNSERIARLSFKLIIDYPPQIKGQDHASIAKFFAFGGNLKDSDLANIDITAKKAENIMLEDQLNELQPTVKKETQEVKSGDYCKFYFHNDGDSVDGDIAAGYEMKSGDVQGIDGLHDFGLNSGFIADSTNFVANILNEVNPENYKLIKLTVFGSASKLYKDKTKEYVYNYDLSNRRNQSLLSYINTLFYDLHGKTLSQVGIDVTSNPLSSVNGSEKGATSQFMNERDIKPERNSYIHYERSPSNVVDPITLTTEEKKRRSDILDQIDNNKKLISAAENFEQKESLFVLRSIKDKENTGFESAERRTLSPVFHSQTPEDFHRRLTFLQQCTRQGNSTVLEQTTQDGIPAARNSVFGRPPVCILRLGDFFHTKVIIDSIDFDYADSPWDMNPEGMGMQFMIADISISMRIIGGQSLKGAIDVLQNAESFNYYANSTYYPVGVYATARMAESAQYPDRATTDSQVKTRTKNNGNIVPTKPI